MPLIRTTIEPWREIDVSDGEYLGLLRQGLIFTGNPPPLPPVAFTNAQYDELDDPNSEAARRRAAALAAPGGALSTELSASFVPSDRIVRAGALGVWGHSYSFGIGASDRSKRFSAIVARALNLPEAVEAISGSTLSFHGSGGAWVKVLQKLARNGTGPISGSPSAASGLNGWSGPGGCLIAMWGINDLNNRGNTPAVLAGFKQDLRAALSRMRSAVVIESDNTSVFTGWTGTWGTSTDNTQNSGANFRHSASGTGFQITLPADFPGGTIAVGFTGQTNAGAVYSVTVDGTEYSIDGRNPYTVAASYTAFVLRIPSLPAGSQVLNFTVANHQSLAIVDYVQWEGSDEPLILLVKQPYAVDYSAYGSTAPGPPTDAGVDALNTILDDVATEFGERVITVDTSPLNHDASMFVVDKLHLSDKGNARVAALILQALAEYNFHPIGQAPRPQRVEYATVAPVGNQTFYDVGDRVEHLAPAAGGNLGWVCVTAGRPGTWKTYGAISA